MQDILNSLNKVRGVRGSLIVGRDGILIASDFGTDADENAMGAVGSQILSALQNALDRMSMGHFRRFLVTGHFGKILMVDAGNAILILLLEKDVNLGMVGVEIKDAVEAIVEKSRL